METQKLSAVKNKLELKSNFKRDYFKMGTIISQPTLTKMEAGRILNEVLESKRRRERLIPEYLVSPFHSSFTVW